MGITIYSFTVADGMPSAHTFETVNSDVARDYARVYRLRIIATTYPPATGSETFADYSAKGGK